MGQVLDIKLERLDSLSFGFFFFWRFKHAVIQVNSPSFCSQTTVKVLFINICHKSFLFSSGLLKNNKRGNNLM